MTRRQIVEALMAMTDDADSLVFAFFHPWTVQCGKLRPMLERIIERGFRVVAFNFHRITERDVEFLYAGNRPISGSTSWFIPRQLYEMGPSCGVILHRRAAGQPAATAMAQLKGKSQPFLNSVGQLRYDFRAPNKSINLIHSSDDWKATVSEALIFFSRQDIECALRNVHGGHFEDGEMRLLKHPAYASMEVVRDEAAATLLIKLRIRALDLLSGVLEPALCAPLFALWDKWLERDYLALTVHEEAKQYAALVVDEQRLLRPVRRFLQASCGMDRPRRSLARRPVAALAEFLQILAEPDGYGEADIEGLMSVPVFFDRWEEQLFKTTLLHFDELRYRRVADRSPGSCPK